MNSRSLVRITLLCVLPLTSMACGYIFVNGPPPNHERLNFFSCTQSRLAPGVDALWTGAVALVIVSVLASSDAEVESNFGFGKGGVVLVYGPWGIATGLSAASGFKKVGQCRDATALLQERLTRSADADSATPSPEALVWRPPLLFPVAGPLGLAPITLPGPTPKASPGN